MKLAINYSSALIFLLNKYPSLGIDFIKAPTMPFPESLAQFDEGEHYRRMLPHLAQPGILALGHPQAELSFNEDLVMQLIRRTNPPHLSTHLDARREYFNEIAELRHQSALEVKRVLAERFLNAIQRVKKSIGIPLLIENFPYYSWWEHFNIGSAPEFISEICESGGCYFLLDLSHARCSAWHFQMDIHEYLNQLPLKLVKEIHMAGSMQRKDEGLRDTHTILVNEDYDLLKYILQRTDPVIVTVEYGGQPDRIMNLKGSYDPISRNNPEELEEIIFKINSIIH